MLDRQLTGQLPQLRQAGSAFLSLLFPPQCPLCERQLDGDPMVPDLCSSCEQDFFSSNRPTCQRCGVYGSVLLSEGNCSQCRTKRFGFDAVYSLAEYEGRVQSAVVRMKYDAGMPLAAALGRKLADQLRQRVGCDGVADRAELVTCVPKYWLKRLLTGVNSAEAIMMSLAQSLELPAAADLLVCRRKIGKQSLLSPEQRRRNVQGAWGVSGAYDIRDLHILLVDDIVTTGATAHEAARELKRAGARRVSTAVVARATTRT